MALKDFVLTKDFVSPMVVNTGHPSKPTRIEGKKFRKGEIIKGELKPTEANPEFVLVAGRLVVPIGFVRVVVTKSVNQTSSFDATKAEKPKIDLKPKDTKTKYIDAFVLGALAGLAAAIIAEKKGWIPANEAAPHQAKLIGAGIGAATGTYLMFRFGNKKIETKKEGKE